MERSAVVGDWLHGVPWSEEPYGFHWDTSFKKRVSMIRSQYTNDEGRWYMMMTWKFSSIIIVVRGAPSHETGELETSPIAMVEAINKKQ